MKSKLYTIHDRLADKHGPILCFGSDDEAKRAVRMSLNADSMMVRCKNDFVLVCLAELDEDSLVVTPCYCEVLPLTEIISDGE